MDLVQARKRKLGLLEDEDNSKLGQVDSVKDNNDFATVVKTRGVNLFVTG